MFSTFKILYFLRFIYFYKYLWMNLLWYYGTNNKILSIANIPRRFWTSYEYRIRCQTEDSLSC